MAASLSELDAMKMNCHNKAEQQRIRETRCPAVPVEALTVADIWIPPGESHQDVPEFLDAASARGGVVLVVGQSTQQVQLDLLRGWVGLLPCHI